MAEKSLSIKGVVRKAALRVAGHVEIPFGGKVGHASDKEFVAAMHRAGDRWWPHMDPDPINPSVGGWGKTPRIVTPADIEYDRMEAIKRLDKAGLELCDADDDHAFTVRWKSRVNPWTPERVMEGVDHG